MSILQRASVLVTHAGNNSVTEALAHGVPMLMLPFSTDQFDGAAAIEAARFGFAAVIRIARPPSSLRTRSDASILSTRHRALDSVAVEIAQHPGAGIARAAVGGWLGESPLS